MKFGQVIDEVIDKVNIYEKYFALFKEPGSKSRPILLFPIYWNLFKNQF